LLLGRVVGKILHVRGRRKLRQQGHVDLLRYVMVERRAAPPMV